MKRAFSLQEILVVVAILMILAALTMPAFMSARAASKQSVCVSNLRQIHSALSLYRAETDGDGTYGSAANMGLPIDLSELAKDQHVPRDVFRCAATNPLSAKNLYNVMYAPDGNYGSMNWTQYVGLAYDNAVIIADYNHEFPDSNHFSPFMTHRGLGLFLDGHVRTVIRRGDWFDYEWWTPDFNY